MTRQLALTAAACLVALAAHVCARAQPAAPQSATPPAASRPQIDARGAPAAGSNPNAQTQEAGRRASADEDFELNIVERRITEESFSASTAVELGGEAGRGLSLRVGVAVGAERIDVLLRNVRGTVRFRASLEEVTRRLGADRPAPAPPPPSPTQ